MTQTWRRPPPKHPTQATTPAEERPAAGEADTPDQKEPGDAHAAALRMLEGAARYGVTSKETITKVIHFAHAPDHILRRAAIPALARLAGRDGHLPLVSLLGDPNATIQGEAAEALALTENKDAIEPIKALLEHKNPEVALRAAIALGRLKDQSGLAVAIRLLRRDNPQTQFAAFALGIIVGQRFRRSAEGVAAARQYIKQYKLKRTFKD